MTDDVADAWERILSRLRAAVAGEFEILREIGSGGMAAVYLAREVALNRQVAIKVMSPALLTGAGMVERFKQEARTIAALDHRNIITIYAVRGSDDLHFFVMKFVKGRSLEHIIRTAGPLPIPIVRGLLFMIGDALGHAHRRGVIHRDVKPANILIDADGNAIVTDFGIAKVAQSEAQTHSAVLLGTPAYMSPEQCYARPATAASDQYSLGVVAYEMITGRLPFPDAKGPAGLITAQLKQTPAPPSQTNPKANLPAAADRAILKALEKNKENRHADVTAMAAALQEVLDQARDTSNPSMAALSASRNNIDMDLLETRKGDMPHIVPPSMPAPAPMQAPMGEMLPRAATPPPHHITPGFGAPQAQPMMQPPPYGNGGAMAMPPQQLVYPQAPPQYMGGGTKAAASTKWVWWVVGLLALGATAGAVLALAMRYL